ncbi:MAG: PAS domain-containing protein [Deltaproteobacteria bacterium]
MDFRMLEEIADHIPGVIFAKSCDGKFIYANREYERLFQVKREWVIGKTNYDLMRFDEQILIDGEWRVYSCIKFPLRDQSGAIYGLAGISTDITEKKRNEEALKEANARLKVLVNAIPDMVIFKDAEGRHLLVNRAAEKFMGLSAEKAAGKTNEELFPPEMAAICQASDEEALAGPRPVHFEESLITRTEETRHFDTIKASIHDEQGNRTIGRGWRWSAATSLPANNRKRPCGRAKEGSEISSRMCRLGCSSPTRRADSGT